MSIKLALLLAVAALLAAGCGGCGDSTASSPVTKAGFVRKAESICNRADAMQPRTLNAFVKKHKDDLEGLAPVPYEETVAKDVTLPSIKSQIKQLEALELPDGEEKKAGSIIAGFKAAVRRGERDPYSVADFWHPANDSFAKINKVAARYGFKACAELR